MYCLLLLPVKLSRCWCATFNERLLGFKFIKTSTSVCFSSGFPDLFYLQMPIGSFSIHKVHACALVTDLLESNLKDVLTIYHHYMSTDIDSIFKIRHDIEHVSSNFLVLLIPGSESRPNLCQFQNLH